MSVFRELFFNCEGMPRLIVWCVAFLFVLVPRVAIKHAKDEEARKQQEQAARREAGLEELRGAKELLANSRLLDARLRARSSMEKLAGNPEYGDAELVDKEAWRRLLDWRKKQASKLLKEAEKATQRRGFSKGGLPFLRPVRMSACQIPRDSPLYRRSVQVLEKATKRAMGTTPVGDLIQRCEAVRQGILDPKAL